MAEERQIETVALSLAELRRRAYVAAGPVRELSGTAAPSSYYARSSAVRVYVLSRAAGKCEELRCVRQEKLHGQPVSFVDAVINV